MINYSSAYETIMDFINEDEDISNLPNSRCLALQSARLEQSYVKFLKQYLAGVESVSDTDLMLS